MSERDGLHKIEVRCDEILRSPYLYKELPEELHRLKNVLNNVDALIREEVPFLITEVKRLRSDNKRLEIDAQASRQALGKRRPRHFRQAPRRLRGRR